MEQLLLKARADLCVAGTVRNADRLAGRDTAVSVAWFLCCLDTAWNVQQMCEVTL